MPLYVKNKNRKTAYTSLIIALAIGMLVGWQSGLRPSFAQSPTDSIRQISLAATLFDSENHLIQSGEYEIRFALYAVDRTQADPYPSVSDARLWEETQTITVQNGVFRAFLGSVTPLPESIDFNSGDYFVGIRIGTDSEIVPRKRLGSVPSARNAEFLQGRVIGNGEGDIAVLGPDGKISIDNLPVGDGEGDDELVVGSDERLQMAHEANTDTGTDSLVFTIGSGTSSSSNRFDLAVGSGSTPPALRYNGSTGAWQFSNDGSSFTDLSGGTVGDIELGTDTIGDYVESIVAGDGLSGAASGEGSTPTLAIDLLDSIDGDGVTSSYSGLEFQGSGSDELTLLQGCSDEQVLKWDEGLSEWICSNDIGGGTAVVNVKEGATLYTGVDTLTFTASDFNISTVSTEATVAIDYANSGITRKNQAETITGAWSFSTAIGVPSGGTGATTFTSNGVLYGNGTGAVQVTAAGTSGQLLVANASGVPTFVTLGTDATLAANGTLTIAANAVALSTDTTGNYVASVANGNGLSGGDGGSEGAALTLAIDLLDSADGTGGTSSNSGLEFQGTGGNELTLLQGCSDLNVLSWDDTANAWECSSVSGVGGISGSGSAGQVAYFTAGSTLAGENQLDPSRGGTGVNASAAANGAFLIGNGSGFSLNTLSQGSGITITNGAGAVTITSTLGTDVDLTSEVTDILPVGNGGTGASTLNNLIALGTHTTGNYVTSITNGGGISGGNGGSEGAALTLSINLLDTADGAGATSSVSGLEFQGGSLNELTLLQGCSDTQVLAWDDTTSEWGCTTIIGIGGVSGSGTAGHVTYWSGASVLASEAQLSVSRGGTGVDGSAAANGALLIGNGTGYTLATLTEGSGITVTEGSGTITIAATLGTDIDLTSEVTSTLPVGNGGTGATTFTSNGVLYGNGTGAVQVTAAGTNGQLLVGVTGSAPAFVSLSSDATISNTGVLTIAANAVALSTDTTGNYVASVTNGNGLSGGDGGSEGAALTLAIDLLDSADGTGGTSSNSGLEFQGTGTNELTLLQGCSDLNVLSWDETNSIWECASVSGVGGVTGTSTSGYVAYWNGSSSLSGEAQLDPSRGGTGLDASAAANGTLLIGNGTGYTLATITDGNGITVTEGSGTISIASTLGTSIDLTAEVTDILPVANGGTGASSLNNLITLGTHSTGNYVATIAGGSIISVTGSGSESAAVTLGITADSINFTELDDALILDNSTDISITGSRVLSLTNSGTGNSFVVNDAASDTTPFVIDANGNVGIKDSSLEAALDLDTSSSSTTAGAEYGAWFTFSDTGIVTTGTDTTFGNRVQLTRTGATGGSITNYGQYITVTGDTGGTSSSYGLYVSVTGADNNYGAYFDSNVGIGDATPAALLTVGSGDLFQVNSSGQIAAAAGITSSGTITFSGLSTAGVVTNNSSGVLSTSIGSNGECLLVSGGAVTWGTCDGAIAADSLDFDDFIDSMSLDASTDIAIDGSEVFSLTNTGTGNSFLVNDAASDTTPFVIDASGNVSIGGALTGTSSSSSALAIGPNGATNPAFLVNASAASSATGVSIVSAAAGSGVTIQALSSATDEDIYLQSKGAGEVYLNTTSSTGSIVLQVNNNSNASRLTIGQANFNFIRGLSANSAAHFLYSNNPDTGITASTEATEVYWELGDTRQHSTGALTLQRDFRITPSTHSFVGASTITDAAAFAVDGAVIAGTNASITNSSTIYSAGSAVGSGVTNSYGLNIAANTGATNNYAAYFSGGNVGIGDSTPDYALDVVGNQVGYAASFFNDGNNEAHEGILIQAGLDDWETMSAETFSLIDFADGDGTIMGSISGTWSAGLAISSGDLSISSTGDLGISTVDASITLGSSGQDLWINNNVASVNIQGGGELYSDASGVFKIVPPAGGSFSIFDDTDEALTVLASNGNVGIGDTTPDAELDVEQTSTATSGSVAPSALIEVYANPGSASTAVYSAAQFAALSQTGNAFSITTMYGTDSTVYHQGSGTVTSATGLWGGLDNTSTGTITNGSAIGAWISNDNASGTIGTAKGLNITDIWNAGTITNTYGIYVGDITAGTQTNTPFSFYASDAGTHNYFAGNVGIGDTSPTALLTVGSGDLFRVNSSGQIAAAAGVTSSGTITFSALSTAGVVINNSSGVLSTDTALDVATGGTNITSYTAGDLLYASGATTLSKLAIGSNGQCLGVSGGALSWTTCGGAALFTDGGTATYLTSLTDDLIIGGDATNEGFWFDVSAATLYLNYDATTYATIAPSSTGDLIISGSGASEAAVIIGTGAAEDASIQYDGNAVDFYAGLDDATDSYMVGLGTTVGTTPYLTVNSSGQLGVGTTSLSDYFVNLAADSTGDYSRGLYISQANNAAEDNYGIYVDTTSSLGTLSASRSLRGLYSSVAPTATLQTSSGSNVFAPYGTQSTVSLSNVTLGDFSGGTQETAIGRGGLFTVSGTPVFNDTNGNGEPNLTAIGVDATVSTTPTLTSVVGGGFYSTYAGRFVNSATSPGSVDLTSAVAYGIRVSNTGDLTTTGTTAKYGGYFENSGTADLSYGLYVTTTGATTNYAAIFDGGNVGIGDTSPTGLLTVGSGDAFTVATDGSVDTPLISAGYGSIGTFSDDGFAGSTFGADVTVDGTVWANADVMVTTNGYFGGNLGVGDTTPDAKFDIDFSSTSTTAGTSYGSYFTISDTGVVTTGTDTTYGNRIDLTRSGATGGTHTTYGQYISNNSTFASGTGSLTSYGLYINSTSSSTGTSTAYGAYIDTNTAGTANADTVYGLRIATEANSTSTAYGLYVDSGATSGDYAAVFLNGNVGIGDSTPDGTLDIEGGATLLELTSTQNSGAIINYAAPASTATLGSLGYLAGVSMDLATNYNTNNASIDGSYIYLPGATHTSTFGFARNTAGYTVDASGRTITINESGSTANFFGVRSFNPDLVQTVGTANAYGVYVDTGSNTTGGTQSGFHVEAAGVGAGSLYGVNLSSITGGAGTENAINVGSGWDNILNSASIDITGSGAITGATGITSSGTITFSSISGSTQCLQVNSSGVVSGTGSGCGGASLFTDGGTATYLTSLTDDLIIGGDASNEGFFFDVSAATLQINYNTSTYATIAAQSDGTLAIGSSNTSESQLILGSGGSTDDSIAFDGASQDWYAGLDHGTGSYMIGSGFVVGTSPWLTITSSGATGIGDSTPDYKLDVETDAASSYAAYFLNDGNNANRYGVQIQAGADDGSGTTYYLNALDGDGTQVGYIANTSGTFALTDISDSRTKTNIEITQMGSAVDILEDIRVVDFNRAQNPDGPKITGFIAQEVQAVYPEAVTTAPNGLLGIMKDAFIPVLVKATQEQQVAIEYNAEKIESIELKTNQNIATLTDLQDSVDEELATAGASLNALTTRQVDLESGLAGAQDMLDTLNDTVGVHESRLSLLETQMAALDDQVSLLSDFYSAFELGSFVSADENGDVDLLSGKLRASVLETGALAINVVDLDAPTIGHDTLLPLVTDADNDGRDDDTDADGRSVFVETKAVSESSRIFTNFAANPGAYSWTEKHQTDGEFDGFTIYLSEPSGDPVEVDWWIVEQQ